MNQFLEKFINSVFIRPGSALDLGAGDFKDVKALKKECWFCEGVDLKTGADLKKPYLSQNASLDLVFSNYVFQFIKNKNQFLKTVSDNLKKDGWLFIHTFDDSDKAMKSGISEEFIKQILLDNGFKDISTKVFDYFDDAPGHNHWHRILEVTAQK
ncbi:MAG: methyltransferase domain-containing protein [Candidatus Wolfebacteria bacterium]|nr:methyltransferase domain-containing protein [Candidatus Wolfebacteria bacterium]